MIKSMLSVFLAIVFCIPFLVGCGIDSDDTSSNDFPDASDFEDLSEKSEIVISSDSSSLDDSSENSNLENSSENSEFEDSSENSKLENSSENSELEDSSDNSELENSSENSELEESSEYASSDSSDSEIDNSVVSEEYSSSANDESDDLNISETLESSVEEDKSESYSESSEEDISISESSEEEISKEEVSEESKPPVDIYAPITPIPETLEISPLDSFFDDSVFIGYSIMMHFGKYISQWKIEIDESIMGDCTFCCGVGMNFKKNRTQTPDEINNTLPKYQGEAYNFEDLPKAVGAKSLYIGLMPYSELKSSTVQNCIEKAVNETINGLEKIKKENPDLHIVILSGTYNTGTYKTGQLNPERVNNNNVRLYNIKILEYCNENGIDFVDVSTPMLDGRGFMPVEYASDGDYHIKKEPFKIWINVLRDFADKKQRNVWKNPETMPPLVNE